MGQATQDYYLEATYADGFVYSGTREDISEFDEKRNCFYDVLERLHEAEHGRLVNWAVIGTLGTRYDVDMTLLPDNARPIFYRDLEQEYNPASGETSEPRTLKWVFGVQWNDDNGRNQQLKEELD